jgi:hypothetical protein
MDARAELRLRLTIRLILINQRQRWTFRDLAGKDRLAQERAREALLDAIDGELADFTIEARDRPRLKAHSTP